MSLRFEIAIAFCEVYLCCMFDLREDQAHYVMDEKSTRGATDDADMQDLQAGLV